MDSKDQSPKLRVFKVVLAGDVGVGKKSFLHKYLRNAFPVRLQPTTCRSEFSSSVISLKDGSHVKLQIWETQRSIKYQAITAAHFRKAKGALLFFDLTNRATFDDLTYWLETFEEYTEEDAIAMLIGTKFDIVQERPDSRQVNQQEAKDFAKKYGLVYKETSSKTGENVKEAFLELGEAMNQLQKEQQKLIDIEKEKSQKSNDNNVFIEKNSVRSDKCFC